MKIVSLSKARSDKNASYGEVNFLVCKCQADKQSPEGHIPVVTHDAKGTLLLSLICLACDNEISIEHGRLV